MFTASAPRPIQSVSCDVCLFFVVWYLWAKIILPDNSDFPFLPYLSNWKTEKFLIRGTHWLGPGFKIGVNSNLTKFREKKENIFCVS